ncbi:hypothetical protein C2G38_2174453 [Gigaspora rosea]|uniref:Uncharacterized protein n=1 Tax=Gigaspora rosea TaxID=44941 RepID=A0A397VJR2_9GLOM|nr:hypothetical protein C2G38_2174453 [Gigaspora rosea]
MALKEKTNNGAFHDCHLKKTRMRLELGVYLSSLNTARIVKNIQFKFTIVDMTNTKHQPKILLLGIEFVPFKFNYEYPQICLSDKPNPFTIRKLLNKLAKANNINNWATLTRIQNWLTQDFKVNWKLTYEHLNYNSQPLARKTDSESKEIKAFKVKILMQKLPTLLTLHIRDPSKTKNKV